MSYANPGYGCAGACRLCRASDVERPRGLVVVRCGPRSPGRQILFSSPRCPVSKVTKLKTRRPAPELDTPTDLDQAAVAAVSEALNGLLADAFALYLKTKN